MSRQYESKGVSVAMMVMALVMVSPETRRYHGGRIMVVGRCNIMLMVAMVDASFDVRLMFIF